MKYFSMTFACLCLILPQLSAALQIKQIASGSQLIPTPSVPASLTALSVLPIFFSGPTSLTPMNLSAKPQIQDQPPAVSMRERLAETGQTLSVAKEKPEDVIGNLYDQSHSQAPGVDTIVVTAQANTPKPEIWVLQYPVARFSAGTHKKADIVNELARLRNERHSLNTQINAILNPLSPLVTTALKSVSSDKLMMFGLGGHGAQEMVKIPAQIYLLDDGSPKWRAERTVAALRSDMHLIPLANATGLNFWKRLYALQDRRRELDQDTGPLADTVSEFSQKTASTGQ